MPVASNAGDGVSYVSFHGYGAAHWGEPLAGVEQALAVSFDCSGGAIPGTCLCPTPGPELPVVLAFDVSGPPRLMSLFTGDPDARTARGIGVGSTRRAVRRAYPSARLVHGGLGGGLSTFYLVRHGGRALAFSVGRRRVNSLSAFQNGRRRFIESEVCA